MSSEKEIADIFRKKDDNKEKKKCDYCNGYGLVTRGEHVFACPKRENHR